MAIEKYWIYDSSTCTILVSFPRNDFVRDNVCRNYFYLNIIHRIVMFHAHIDSLQALRFPLCELLCTSFHVGDDF